MGALPEDLRPDKSRIMFSLEAMDEPRILFEKVFIVGRSLDESPNYNSQAVSSALKILSSDGTLPIWLSHKGRGKNLHFPHQQIASVISSPYSMHTPSARLEAKEWIARYEANLQRINYSFNSIRQASLRQATN
ncbi:hypothetical protein [Janthinobacterium agaricidamnosum]|uniref:hypothetical protein n=1 Tax=Janthinobacterium agaricidamnosum TaxID=55508 RepID=UPI001185DE54|nr:hypothetical protein [Janthinobacterium agaricidamnosum]